MERKPRDVLQRIEKKKCFLCKDCHSKIYPFKMTDLKQKYVWFNSGTSLINFYKCIFRVQLLFSDSKTMTTLVNYTLCKSFIKLTPAQSRRSSSGSEFREKKWENSQVSLHNKRCMSQARRTRKRVGSAFRAARVGKFADCCVLCNLADTSLPR